MTDQEKPENLSVTRNLLANSSSEHNLVPDNSLSSRLGESLPSMNYQSAQTTQIESNLSRFSDDIHSTNLNNGNLDTSSPTTASTASAEQNDEQPSENTNNEPEKPEETKDVSQSDDALNEHEKQQQQQEQKEENNETPPTEEKPNENLDITPVHSADPTSINITRVYIREFVPTSADDPTFSILRALFVRSSDEFYKQIETQLNLKSEKSLLQWLNEKFDKEEQEILAKKYRCFLLCGNDNENSNEIILGFLTLKEEEEEQGSIYIAQIAIRLEFKHRGYGTQLLHNLRNIYPPNTKYSGLCLRANRPALQFFLKQGAEYIESDEIAAKYDHDPIFYGAFEFEDTNPVTGSQNPPLEQSRTNAGHSEEEPTTITDATENNENPPLTDDEQQALQSLKKNKKKVVGCCNIS